MLGLGFGFGVGLGLERAEEAQVRVEVRAGAQVHRRRSGISPFKPTFPVVWGSVSYQAAVFLHTQIVNCC